MNYELFYFYYKIITFRGGTKLFVFPGSAFRCGRTTAATWSRKFLGRHLHVSCSYDRTVFVFTQTNVVYLPRGRERAVDIKEAERARVRGVWTHSVRSRVRLSAAVLLGSPPGLVRFGPVQVLGTTDRRNLFGLQRDESPAANESCPRMETSHVTKTEAPPPERMKASPDKLLAK